MILNKVMKNLRQAMMAGLVPIPQTICRLKLVTVVVLAPAVS